MQRQGVSQEQARRRMIGNSTLIGAMMVRRGDADALICGTFGAYRQHFDIIAEVVGFNNPQHLAGAMNALMLPNGNIFIADTYVNADPDAEQLAEMAAKAMKRFGIAPKAALLSNSSFGTVNCPSAVKMREALALIREHQPTLEIDGEMQGDAALVEHIRLQAMPDTTLKGSANLLVMPNIEAANITYNLLRVSASDGVTIGPILMGMAKPVHILTPISSARRIINMVALACVDAQSAN
jgi:malate dehydrogenase (oxaloacetate-decarboxylating)(NADP+)